MNYFASLGENTRKIFFGICGSKLELAFKGITLQVKVIDSGVAVKDPE